MAEYRYALFDFDGTVGDTKYSVMASAAKALEHYGISADEKDLKRFVGPNLWYSFGTFYGFDKPTQDEAVKIYRDYYAREGIYKAVLYPGMDKMLLGLRQSGIKTAIATIRTETSLEQNLTHMGIKELFDATAGSLENGERSDKAQLIEYVLGKLGSPKIEECVFIGDSHTDYEGAKAMGMDFIAALHDRPESEFEGLPIVFKAFSVEEIARIIYEGKAQTLECV
ncbi:MAG: HAD hydrolase-like protein [Eubacteriaceae bacterium]|nr:HAD hydrolase-like protein [Eubacteriaceae bacterium]